MAFRSIATKKDRVEWLVDNRELWLGDYRAANLTIIHREELAEEMRAAGLYRVSSPIKEIAERMEALLVLAIQKIRNEIVPRGTRPEIFMI